METTRAPSPLGALAIQDLRLDDDRRPHAQADDMAELDPGLQHPFQDHLIALLSVYDLGPGATPIPRYEGPATWQTQHILRSLDAIVRRMFTAEEAYNAIKAAEACAGRETKKRRSVGDSPPISCGTSVSSNSSADLTYATSATAGSNGYLAGSQSPFFTPSSSLDSVNMNVDALNVFGIDNARKNDVRPSSDPTPSVSRRNGSARPASPMTISLDGVVNPLEKTQVYHRTMGNGPASAPPSTNADHVACPSCGNIIADSSMMAKIASLSGPPVSSPMVIPPGPLAAAAFESGMSAVEELKLLKAQVQDVAKVCNAVARGDLSQKITVPVQGPVMVQLKEVINQMVSPPNSLYPRA